MSDTSLSNSVRERSLELLTVLDHFRAPGYQTPSTQNVWSRLGLCPRPGLLGLGSGPPQLELLLRPRPKLAGKWTHDGEKSEHPSSQRTESVRTRCQCAPSADQRLHDGSFASPHVFVVQSAPILQRQIGPTNEVWRWHRQRSGAFLPSLLALGLHLFDLCSQTFELCHKNWDLYGLCGFGHKRCGCWHCLGHFFPKPGHSPLGGVQLLLLLRPFLFQPCQPPLERWMNAWHSST